VVSKKENDVQYQWDITKVMFSSGNITEKQRISQWDLRERVVVDLFAGIGYFTLNYLIHTQAKLVYACEWNPEALKWLRNNLRLNKVDKRCIVLEGDNLVTCPKGVADHVNLGLIPSSEASWGVACAALKRKTGGVLHVHGNVDLVENKKSKCWNLWSENVGAAISEHFQALYPDESRWIVDVVGVSKIKSYGPRVDHVVADVLCSPFPSTLSFSR
jgi:tRNA G37 N-methylase Trm5